MRDVRAGVAPADVAGTARIERFFFGKHLRAGHEELSCRGKCNAMTRIVRRYYAIECINAQLYNIGNIFDMPYAKQMPRFLLRQPRERPPNNITHPVFVAAKLPADTETRKWQRTDIPGTLFAHVPEPPALHNTKKCLARSMNIQAHIRPTMRTRHRPGDIRLSSSRRRTFIECKQYIGPERLLYAHG